MIVVSCHENPASSRDGEPQPEQYLSTCSLWRIVNSLLAAFALQISILDVVLRMPSPQCFIRSQLIRSHLSSAASHSYRVWGLEFTGLVRCTAPGISLLLLLRRTVARLVVHMFPIEVSLLTKPASRPREQRRLSGLYSSFAQIEPFDLPNHI
jgi:hypothetical protein